jgi:hypothetical protein
MPVQGSHWQPVLDGMFEELRSDSPRAEVYWAQQLAFGPVFERMAVGFGFRFAPSKPPHIVKVFSLLQAL